MSQNGKGMKPRAGYNQKAYRDNWDAIFAKDRLKCDICGRFISSDALDKGKAVRYLDESDNAFGGEVWVTYHTKCRAKELGANT